MVGWIVLALAACSGGETPLGDMDAEGGVEDAAEGGDGPPDDAAPDGDAEPEADGTAGAVSVLVRFVDWPGDPVAAPGVVVAFDAPDGTRSEAPTGADGRVSFDVADWSAGTASVTAWAEDRQLVSRVGITAADGEVGLELWRLGNPVGFVELSGTVTSIPYEEDALTVSATVPSTFFGSDYLSPGADWSVMVPPSTPCKLIASARRSTARPSGRGFDQIIDGWAMVDQPAVDGPTVVSIDFVANAATPTTVAGSYLLPVREESRLHGPASYGWLWVTSADSKQSGAIGLTTMLDINADGTALEFGLEYLQPAGITRPMTCYLVNRNGASDSARSVACEEGWPTAGAHDPGLLDAPTLVPPGTPSTRRPLFGGFTWQIFDHGVHVALHLVRDGAYVWTIVTPDDATSLSVPQPPSTINLAELLGSHVAQGDLTIWQMSAAGDYQTKAAVSELFIVEF
ncbi:MAG: Ig-like domain-containing protein [Deltaproteobacteria bacterium]|nr:Ig-like domain-containing protein [Deltaproteobacteria bacterium]